MNVLLHMISMRTRFGALAVGKKTEMLATGGSDAFNNLWHDSTALDKEEAFRKEEEEGVLRFQELQNALSDADYTKAIQLAFELCRAHKLFELFAELCRKTDAEDKIQMALSAIGKEEFHLLLEYVREWNTKPKLCHVAQFVLFLVFSILPPTQILEVKGVGELLEGLIPYSQRHFSRIDRLQKSTYWLDYKLAGMSVIEPETGESSKDRHVENSWGTDHEQLSEAATTEESEEKTKEHAKDIPSKKRKSGKLEEIESFKDDYAEISLGAVEEQKEETEESAKNISARKSGNAGLGLDTKVNIPSSMNSLVISAEA